MFLWMMQMTFSCLISSQLHRIKLFIHDEKDGMIITIGHWMIDIVFIGNSLSKTDAYS